ncbi:integrator complex subunit 5-like [Mytilus edulis]|uniref:integrator complex subunit 5-like n=1 Tax=Mytilus edulis TaxID=6550 RepID=UPI0039EE6143
MATATEHLTSKDVLTDLRLFLQGVNRERQVSNQALTKSALYLLQTLPVARHAVFEYLCNVFEEAVQIQMKQLQFHEFNQDDLGESSNALDSIIQDACGVLFNFIKTNPAAWAPIISSWSLELLGHLSGKYSTHRGVPHSGSLNELLQLWMTCKPTKSLIEVATECFAAMVKGAPEVCVDSLLEASVKYSPHFDWVVAHIGSCFPTTIITRVLMSGLKDYYQHGGKPGEGHMSSDDKMPKMASAVGILGHLASKHGQDIRNALMKLFEASLTAESEMIRKTTIPFLLKLASLSPMLLNILTTDLINALTPEVLNQLNTILSQWKNTSHQEYESFLLLVVHLVIQSDIGAYQVLQFFLQAAIPIGTEAKVIHEDIQDTCSFLIDQLLREVQSAVYHRQNNGMVEVPFLASLTPKVKELTRMLLQSDGMISLWLMKLLSYVALYSGEECTSEILVCIISEATNFRQLSRCLDLQSTVEVKLGDVLPCTIHRLVDMLNTQQMDNVKQLLGNLLCLVQWESTSHVAKEYRSLYQYCIHQQWESFLPLLSNSDTKIAITMLKIINIVKLPKVLSSPVTLTLCSSLSELFFRILEIEDSKTAFEMVTVCKQCMKQLINSSYVQTTILRFFIEALFTKEISVLFGGKIDPSSLASEKDTYTKLKEENMKHGLSLTLPRSHSSVFHAGVIGKGLKPRTHVQVLKQPQVVRNKQCLVELLAACSVTAQGPEEVHTPMETDNMFPVRKRRSTLSAELCRMVGSLITELATPDVLYNNRFWPEEDSIRITVERDLFVWKIFEDNQVLWDVFDLYSSSPLAMCRCSPVLKSITASLMNFFESCRQKQASHSPRQMEACCKLVRCLSKSRLLPTPLKFISELFPLVTSYEAYLLLVEMWKYIKENPPTEDPEEVNKRVCEPRHTVCVRSILHKDIHRMGHIYSRFFHETMPPSENKMDD